MPNIFDYSELREFLKDALVEAKAKNPRWSVRSWAMKMHLPGPSGLSMVMNGQRNVGPKLAVKLVRYFKFTEAESDYFSGLMRLAQGPQSASLISMLRAGAEKPDAKPEASHPSEDIDLAFRWYFYAIREMSLLDGFSDDPVWIAQRLRGSIAVEQVEATLGALLRMGFMARDTEGKLRPAPGSFDAGPGTEALGRRYQAEILELGLDALTNDPVDQRGFFSSTLTISRSDMPAAKDAIRKFRLEFEKRFEKKAGDSTVQLNVQLFSVGQPKP